MSFTITLGWWLVPTAVTVIALTWVTVWQSRQPQSSGYGSIGAGLGEALMLLLAVVVSAFAWIVYLAIALWTK